MNNPRINYYFFYLLSILLMGISFVFNTPYEIYVGLEKIITSPCNLLTDYMALTCIGAAIFNAALLLLISTMMLDRNNIHLSGPHFAALFTIAGFSLFGKNIYNSISITFGVYLYSKIERTSFATVIIPALFGTSLGPLVSYISFGLSLPLPLGILLGQLSGITIGLIIAPLSSSFIRFHHGYNLYNVGFTAGIIGMAINGIFKMFDVKVVTTSILSEGHNKNLLILLFFLFFLLISIGSLLNDRSIKDAISLFNEKGRLVSDFILRYGLGLTLINMGVLGIIATVYAKSLAQDINGPIIGGIFTIVGFGSFGKTPKNVIPILVGIYITNALNIIPPNSTVAVLSALFGTTLAPIAGEYGPIAGIVAGFLHMAVVTNVGFLHGGMNLYNNGFSGGFVAAFLVPILDSIRNVKEVWKK